MLVKSVENKDVGVNGKSSNIINQMVGCLKITASGLKSKEVFTSCLRAKLGFFRRVWKAWLWQHKVHGGDDDAGGGSGHDDKNNKKSTVFQGLLQFGGFGERLLADDLFLVKVAIEAVPSRSPSMPMYAAPMAKSSKFHCRFRRI